MSHQYWLTGSLSRRFPDVSMMQAADTRQRLQRRLHVRLRLNNPASRSILAQPQMGAIFVIVGNELATEPADMRFVDRDQVIEAFTARGADPKFGDAILPRTADTRSDRRDPRRIEQRQHFRTEFGVAIKDGLLARAGIRERLAQLLADPFGGRMRGHVEVQDPAATVVEYEEAVAQFAMDFRRAPECILFRDAVDSSVRIGVDLAAAETASPAPKSPVEPKARLVPTLLPQGVHWGIAFHVYSEIAHIRTVLAGLIDLAEAGNTPSANILSRHIFEWTAHACYMTQHLKVHVGGHHWKEAFQLLLMADTGNGWAANHGHDYDAAPIPVEALLPIRIKKLIAAYRKYQTEQYGRSRVEDTYGFLSEYSHPNAACFLQYREFDGRRAYLIAPPPRANFGGINGFIIEWLMFMQKLPGLAREDAVRDSLIRFLPAIVESAKPPLDVLPPG